MDLRQTAQHLHAGLFSRCWLRSRLLFEEIRLAALMLNAQTPKNPSTRSYLRDIIFACTLYDSGHSIQATLDSHFFVFQSLRLEHQICQCGETPAVRASHTDCHQQLGCLTLHLRQKAAD